jgi:lipopolysaccharide cholinephosphotransferase
MKIRLDVMDKMHKIHLEMLLELIRVMETLNIKYYFVHGSLLGAIRDHDFIQEDDDIDIAIFRSDYNKLFENGNTIIDSNYFLQNSVTDSFPLPMGKMRKNNTAFIQPILSKCNCNKGLYIDIFPIDYYCDSIIFRIKKTLLSFRINNMYAIKKSWKQKIGFFVSLFFYPSIKKALVKREMLFGKVKRSNFVNIYCGKPTEIKMPIGWFKTPMLCEFCNTQISIPNDYGSYLSRIYGKDYLKKNPAKSRISDDNEVEISADILDFENSYLIYENQ